LRGIGVGGAADQGDAGDAGLLAIGVVKQHAVADIHLVAHEVARLIVAHAIPGHGLIGKVGEIVYADIGRLGFHQPVAHGSGPEIKSATQSNQGRTGIEPPACAVDPAS